MPTFWASVLREKFFFEPPPSLSQTDELFGGSLRGRKPHLHLVRRLGKSVRLQAAHRHGAQPPPQHHHRLNRNSMRSLLRLVVLTLTAVDVVSLLPVRAITNGRGTFDERVVISGRRERARPAISLNGGGEGVLRREPRQRGHAASLFESARRSWRERKAATQNLRLKLFLEVMWGASLQFAAEYQRRGFPGIYRELDYVLAGILTAVCGKT